MRIHITPGRPALDITMYGYQFGDDPTPYWSMRFYAELWHVPMHPKLNPKI